jgi:hypothetical protein
MTATAGQISRLLQRQARPTTVSSGLSIAPTTTWLINLSELPALLGVKPVRSELTYLLVSLDKQYTADQPGAPWEDYYAQRILGHFSPPGR